MERLKITLIHLHVAPEWVELSADPSESATLHVYNHKNAEIKLNFSYYTHLINHLKPCLLFLFMTMQVSLRCLLLHREVHPLCLCRFRVSASHLCKLHV